MLRLSLRASREEGSTLRHSLSRDSMGRREDNHSSSSLVNKVRGRMGLLREDNRDLVRKLDSRQCRTYPRGGRVLLHHPRRR